MAECLPSIQGLESQPQIAKKASLSKTPYILEDGKLALDSVFEEFSGSWRGGASGALLSYWRLARECEQELGLAITVPGVSHSWAEVDTGCCPRGR